MFELVAVNRMNPKEQKRVRMFNDRQEAVEEAERRRKAEPLTYYVVFIHLSWFCRIITYHTL